MEGKQDVIFAIQQGINDVSVAATVTGVLSPLIGCGYINNWILKIKDIVCQHLWTAVLIILIASGSIGLFLLPAAIIALLAFDRIKDFGTIDEAVYSQKLKYLLGKCFVGKRV